MLCLVSFGIPFSTCSTLAILLTTAHNHSIVLSFVASQVENNRTCAKSIRAVPDFTFEAWPSAGVNNFTTEAVKVRKDGSQ